ncbi:hypothetical protein BJ684DRAFT_16433, partial [Piptocephalis cylindrospora]
MTDANSPVSSDPSQTIPGPIAIQVTDTRSSSSSSSSNGSDHPVKVEGDEATSTSPLEMTQVTGASSTTETSPSLVEPSDVKSNHSAAPSTQVGEDPPDSTIASDTPKIPAQSSEASSSSSKAHPTALEETGS